MHKHILKTGLPACTMRMGAEEGGQLSLLKLQEAQADGKEDWGSGGIGKTARLHEPASYLLEGR